jgi:hypothetical protein
LSYYWHSDKQRHLPDVAPIICPRLACCVVKLGKAKLMQRLEPRQNPSRIRLNQPIARHLKRLSLNLPPLDGSYMPCPPKFRSRGPGNQSGLACWKAAWNTKFLPCSIDGVRRSTGTGMNQPERPAGTVGVDWPRPLKLRPVAAIGAGASWFPLEFFSVSNGNHQRLSV